MSDEADIANELAEQHLQHALANHRVTGNENLTGKCHWCGDPTRSSVCSRECRDDMNKAERFKR